MYGFAAQVSGTTLVVKGAESFSFASDFVIFKDKEDEPIAAFKLNSVGNIVRLDDEGKGPLEQRPGQ